MKHTAYTGKKIWNFLLYAGLLLWAVVSLFPVLLAVGYVYAHFL